MISLQRKKIYSSHLFAKKGLKQKYVPGNLGILTQFEENRKSTEKCCSECDNNQRCFSGHQQ